MIGVVREWLGNWYEEAVEVVLWCGWSHSLSTPEERTLMMRNGIKEPNKETKIKESTLSCFLQDLVNSRNYYLEIKVASHNGVG